ncbi:MAG: hypothetical protein ACPGEF_01130 [Endozoicomonas sp.]
MLRIIFAVGLFLTTPAIHAGIYMNNVHTSHVLINDNPGDWIPHSITLNFSPRCTAGCSGFQRYRLSFSDVSIGGENTTDTVFYHKSNYYPNNLNVSSLDDVMGLQVTYAGTGTNNQTMAFNLRNWSGEVDNVSSTDLSVTFDFNLNKQALKALAANSNSLDFYVIGEDTESSHYIDSIKVSIPIFDNPMVKISKLRDIKLSKSRLRASTKACVYSTTGKVSLDFDGNNSLPNNAFYLTNSASSQINYMLTIRDKINSIEENLTTETALRNLEWDANDNSKSCSGSTNMLFIVKALPGTSSSQSGVYSDTMTVTVSPR